MPRIAEPNAQESILRFMDVVKERFHVQPAELTTRHYKTLAVTQATETELRRRAIATLPEWEAARNALRESFTRALGPFATPEFKTREAGIVERSDYIVRKIVFSAFKDDWVPANIYLPKPLTSKIPAVLLPCGHSIAGKSAYWKRAVSLVRNGYVAMTYDLPGAGERQLTSAESGIVYSTSTQHNILGEPMTLAGYTLGWFFVQETMAAVTYLCGLSEVDNQRIGITGSSGGGWLSVHAAAMDERISVIVPAASVGSRRFDPMPDDSEQIFFDMQRQGLDYPDLIGLLICPRPIFIVANSRDIWNIKSTKYAHHEATRFYKLHRCPERIGMQVWDKGHVYDSDQWLMALRWLQRWLKPEEPAGDPVLTDSEPPLSFEELAATPSGSLKAAGYTPTNRVFAQETREKPSKRNIEGFLDFLRANTMPRRPIEWGRLDRFEAGRATGQRLWFVPEQGLLLPADALIPPCAAQANVLLDENNRANSLAWAMKIVAEGQAVICPDLRGLGEMLPLEEWSDWEGWARNLYDNRRRQAHALARMTGRRLPFDRATDILALLDVLEQLVPGLPITIRAKGLATISALLAALADKRITRLVLQQGLASYQDILDTELPLWGAEGFIYGIFQWGLDLPDLRAAYSGKLEFLDPLNALLQPVS